MASNEEEEVIEEKSIITLKGKKKMISNDVQGEENLRSREKALKRLHVHMEQ